MIVMAKQRKRYPVALIPLIKAFKTTKYWVNTTNSFRKVAPDSFHFDRLFLCL